MDADLSREPRKFTLSCSKCRASKLKCDQKEPCIECLKRDVGHLCTKDVRQPRAKRAKTYRHEGADTSMDVSTNIRSDVEDTARVLESLADETTLKDAHLLVGNKHENPMVASDYLNSYWSADGLQRQDVQLALIREIVDAMPKPDMIWHLYEVFTTRCQGPLFNVVHTPTFLAQAEELRFCLGCDKDPEQQAMILWDRISMDTLACHLLALALALAFHPTPTVHGWSPTNLSLQALSLRNSSSTSEVWRSLGLRCLQGRVSLFFGSIAALQAAIMLLLDGQEEPSALDAILVTAISGAQKLGLHQLGEASLEVPASLRSSVDNCSSTCQHLPFVRTEIGVRIWWALVVRDWSRANALGYYSIQPSHFNTRRPLHIDEGDLCPPRLRMNDHGQIAERPRSEFTTMSYSVHAIEIATFARESMELRNILREFPQGGQSNGRAQSRDHLMTRYEVFLANLPSHFRPGSTAGLRSSGPEAAIPVHRWMLYQQLWTIFLRLNRASPLSSHSLATSRLLAHNIIDSQSHMQARCAVCGSLSSNDRQLLHAAIALLVSLLFPPKGHDASTPSARLNRLMTRDKVGEAMELLREQPEGHGTPSSDNDQPNPSKTFAQRSVGILESLLELEEEEHSNDGQRSNANVTPPRTVDSATPSLTQKIVNTFKRLQQNNKSTSAEATSATSRDTRQLPHTPISIPTDEYGPKDLDVLPMLSSNSGYDFWQFLDTYPLSLSFAEDGFFKGPV